MLAKDLPEPHSPEWDAAIERNVRAKQFDEEVAQTYAELKGEGVSSWERVDLHDVIYGNLPEIAPGLLCRDDGEPLGYPGCTHSIHGPAGSGKTWLTLLAVAERLKRGEHALYLDYESFPVQIVRRLAALDVSNAAIEERLHYYRPQGDPDSIDADRNAFSDLLSRQYAVAVIDGANISMALCDLNPDSATDVARWHAKIMLPVAEKTGAATFANDHVPKNNSPSGFAIGSQHKVAGLTGAAFVVEKIVPFGRGRHGVATVRVSHEKDREGYLHGIGTDDGQPDGLLVAELHVNAEIAPTMVSLCTPTKATIDQVAEKRAKRKGGNRATEVTYEMEVVSAYWQQMTGQPEQRSQNKTVDALLARQSSGTTYERPLTNRSLRLAVKALADPATQGGPYAKEDDTITLRGGSHPYTSLRAYTRAGNNGVVIHMTSLSHQQKG